MDSGLQRLKSIDAAENRISVVEEEALQLPALDELWLKGNPIDRLKLQEMAGFKEFLERRKQRLDEKINANVVGAVDLRVCGLDYGGNQGILLGWITHIHSVLIYHALSLSLSLSLSFSLFLYLF